MPFSKPDKCLDGNIKKKKINKNKKKSDHVQHFK